VGVRNGTLKEGVALKVLLRELGAELATPLYHHIPSLAAALGIRRPPARCSVFLLYWYKSTDTDASGGAWRSTPARQVLSFLALLVQKYRY
jgi:hypothetical protein